MGLAADDKDADDPKAKERAGTFKRADIYKMHAYRDAIPDARSCGYCTRVGSFGSLGCLLVGARQVAGRLLA